MEASGIVTENPLEDSGGRTFSTSLGAKCGWDSSAEFLKSFLARNFSWLQAARTGFFDEMQLAPSIAVNDVVTSLETSPRYGTSTTYRVRGLEVCQICQIWASSALGQSGPEPRVE